MRDFTPIPFHNVAVGYSQSEPSKLVLRYSSTSIKTLVVLVEH